jgi:hypothetical protein
MFEPALNTKQAASFLGLSPGSLAVWRCRGTGPPCHYSASKPIYYQSELKEWQIECSEQRRAEMSKKEAIVSGETSAH